MSIIYFPSEILGHQNSKPSGSEETTLKSIIDLFDSSLANKKERASLKQKIEALPLDDFSKLLNMYFEKFWENIDPENPFKHFERLQEVLPFEQLQKVIYSKYTNNKNALAAAKEMLETAKYFLETVQGDASSMPLRAKLSSALDSSVIALENLISALGIADFCKPPENEFHASFKFQKLMMLVSIFSLLTALLVPALGQTTASYVVSGCLITISVLSFVFPKIRPKPSVLPEGENFSKKYREGKLHVSEGRECAIQHIANTLTANGKDVKTHPLLIGKTGVGKTETVKAFVKKLSDGEFPELKGKTVFYFNTADIVNSKEMFGGGNKALKKISEQMEGNRENIILVFDEIHLACQKKHSVFGEQLKTLLDKDFPYVIGLTTEEEYYRDIWLSNAAFARRFSEVNIESTDKSQTATILNRYYLRHAPQVILENGTIAHIIQNTGNEQQPLASLKVLSQCVKKVSDNQTSKLEKDIETLRDKILHQRSTHAVMAFDTFASMDEELSKMEKELEGLQSQLKLRNEELKRLVAAKKALLEIKKQCFKSVLKISEITKNSLNSKETKLVTGFLLMRYFLAPALEKEIRMMSEKLGVASLIDTSLVDTVLKEEAANKEKAQSMVSKGQSQLQQRANISNHIPEE